MSLPQPVGPPPTPQPQVGVALQNALLFRRSQRSSARVHSVLELVRNMHSDLNVNSLMFTITQRAHALVDADRCTLFMADHRSNELYSLQGEVNIRIRMDQGIAGAVATSGTTINIPDAYLVRGRAGRLARRGRGRSRVAASRAGPPRSRCLATRRRGR